MSSSQPRRNDASQGDGNSPPRREVDKARLARRAATWFAVGWLFGIAIGAACGNVAIGQAAGIGIGSMIGVAMAALGGYFRKPDAERR